MVEPPQQLGIADADLHGIRAGIDIVGLRFHRNMDHQLMSRRARHLGLVRQVIGIGQPRQRQGGGQADDAGASLAVQPHVIDHDGDHRAA